MRSGYIGCRPNRLLRDQGGAALIEAAIIFPVLILIVLAVADIGFALSKYFLVHHAMHEALVSASTLPCDDQSSEGLGLTAAELLAYQNCVNNPLVNGCSNLIMKWRLNHILDSEQVRTYLGPSQQWAVDASTNMPGSPCTRTVEVQVNYIPFTASLWGLWGGDIPMRLTSVGGGYRAP